MAIVWWRQSSTSAASSNGNRWKPCKSDAYRMHCAHAHALNQHKRESCATQNVNESTWHTGADTSHLFYSIATLEILINVFWLLSPPHFAQHMRSMRRDGGNERKRNWKWEKNDERNHNNKKTRLHIYLKKKPAAKLLARTVAHTANAIGPIKALYVCMRQMVNQ